MLFLLLLPPQQLLQQHMLLHSQGGALQKLSTHSTLTSAGDGKEKTAQQVLAFPSAWGSQDQAATQNARGILHCHRQRSAKMTGN